MVCSARVQAWDHRVHCSASRQKLWETPIPRQELQANNHPTMKTTVNTTYYFVFVLWLYFQVLRHFVNRCRGNRTSSCAFGSFEVCSRVETPGKGGVRQTFLSDLLMGSTRNAVDKRLLELYCRDWQHLSEFLLDTNTERKCDGWVQWKLSRSRFKPNRRPFS